MRLVLIFLIGLVECIKKGWDQKVKEHILKNYNPTSIPSDLPFKI